MAKKKLTKKIAEDKVEEDTLEWEIEIPEGLLSDSVFQEEDIPPPPAPPEPQWTFKTFFDFTYSCCHPENTSHCIECYNKARKG